MVGHGGARAVLAISVALVTATPAGAAPQPGHDARTVTAQCDWAAQSIPLTLTFVVAVRTYAAAPGAIQTTVACVVGGAHGSTLAERTLLGPVTAAANVAVFPVGGLCTRVTAEALFLDGSKSTYEFRRGPSAYCDPTGLN